MAITFDWITVSFGLLVVCIALFYLWLRAENKIGKKE